MKINLVNPIYFGATLGSIILTYQGAGKNLLRNLTGGIAFEFLIVIQGVMQVGQKVVKFALRNL